MFQYDNFVHVLISMKYTLERAFLQSRLGDAELRFLCDEKVNMRGNKSRGIL